MLNRTDLHLEQNRVATLTTKQQLMITHFSCQRQENRVMCALSPEGPQPLEHFSSS